MSTQFLIDMCHHGNETQIMKHFEPSDFNTFFFIEACRANRSIDILNLFTTRNKDLLCQENLLYLFKSSHKQVFRTLLDMIGNNHEMLQSILLMILYNGDEEDIPLLEYMQHKYMISETLSFRSIQPHSVGIFRHWLLEHINPLHKFIIMALMGFDFEQNRDKILRLLDQGVRPHCLLDVLLEMGNEDDFRMVIEHCAEYKPSVYLLSTAVKSSYPNIFQLCMKKTSEFDNQLLITLLDDCIYTDGYELENAIWLVSNYFDTFVYEDLITIVISSNSLAIVECLVDMNREQFCQHVECGNIENIDVLRYVIDVLGDAFVMTDELMWTFISNNVEDAVPDYILSCTDDIIENSDIFVDKKIELLDKFHEKYPGLLEKIKQEGFYWACSSMDIEQMRWWYSTFKDITLDQDIFKVLCKNDFVEGVQFFIAETKTMDLYIMDTGFIAAGKKGCIKILDLFISLDDDRYFYKIVDAMVLVDQFIMRPKVQMSIAVFNETKTVSRSEGTCSICLGDQPNVITTCDHMFCRECITDWFRKSKKMMCPYCRGCVEQCVQLKLI